VTFSHVNIESLENSNLFPRKFSGSWFVVVDARKEAGSLKQEDQKNIFTLMAFKPLVSSFWLPYQLPQTLN